MNQRFILSAAIATLLAAHAGAAPLYWDGTGTSWNSAASWSTDPAATTPDALPGAGDLATFNINGLVTTQTISFDADQAAMGLSLVSTGTTSLQGGGTNRVLSLGASGITAGAGTTVFNIGSATAGQNVSVSLQADQTWAFNGSNVANRGIFVNNGVSLGVVGAHTLTLGGTTGSTAISGILGSIGDGAGTLGLTMNGGITNRWNLNAANSYTGATSILSGALGIQVASGLGAISAGTTVASGAALFLRNGGNVTYSAEPLTIAGLGPTGSNRGALRQVPAGNSIWTGPITADTTGGTVRIGADAGTLTINSAVTTIGSGIIDFETTGSITVSGGISGSVALTKTTGGGGTGLGVLTLGGTNSYTGTTTVNVSVLSVTGSLTNTSGVTVAVGGALRGSGTINSAAPVTVNGTLGAGANASQTGTLTLGSVSLTSTATLSIDLNTSSLAHDRAVVNGNFSLDSGNTVTLALTDLGSGATLGLGTEFLIVDYSGTWNGGLLRFGGTPIADDTGTFVFGANTYAIDYNAGASTNDLVLRVVIPEPTTTALLLAALAACASRRRRG